jgi:hypothetical protein
MVVMSTFGDKSIPHNTVVTNVIEEVITVNNTIVDSGDIDLIFLDRVPNLVPFSIVIEPAAGKALTLKSNIGFRSAVVNYVSSTNIMVDGAVVDAKSIQLDNARGVAIGMAVISVSTVIDPNSIYDYVRVESVDVFNDTIVVSTNQTIPDNEELLFYWPEDDPNSDSYDQFGGGNSGVGIQHVQAQVIDGDLVVDGYLRLENISRDGSTIDVYIDDLVTVV